MTLRTLLFLVTALILAPMASAEQESLQISTGDSMQAVLAKQSGKRVTLTLRSGQEMTGIVTAVGDRLIHLEKLSGKEFFDAVVSIDEVAAVSMRVRS